MVNTVVSQILQVSAGTVPLVCLVMFLLYAAAGYLIIRRTEKRWEAKGRRYVETESDRQMVRPERDNLPGLAVALIPMILVIFLYTGLTSGWFAFVGIKRLEASNSILASMGVACIACYLLNLKTLRGSEKDIIFKGMAGGLNPTFAAAVIAGFGSHYRLTGIPVIYGGCAEGGRQSVYAVSDSRKCNGIYNRRRCGDCTDCFGDIRTGMAGQPLCKPGAAAADNRGKYGGRNHVIPSFGRPSRGDGFCGNGFERVLSCLYNQCDTSIRCH